MLRGIQKTSEKTTTEPTMLSARNFPEGTHSYNKTMEVTRGHEKPGLLTCFLCISM